MHDNDIRKLLASNLEMKKPTGALRNNRQRPRLSPQNRMLINSSWCVCEETNSCEVVLHNALDSLNMYWDGKVYDGFNVTSVPVYNDNDSLY